MKNTLINLLNIVGKKNKKLPMVFLLVFIATILEMLGISIIIPLLSIMSNHEYVDLFNSNYSKYFFIEDNLNQTQLIYLLLIILSFVYLIKFLYLSFFYWYQAKFVFEVQKDTSKLLFNGYINAPYLFHLQKNSSELIRNIVGETSLLNQCLISTITFFIEILVITGILTILIINSPYESIIVAISLLLVSYLIYKLTKLSLDQLGEDRQIHEEKRIKHIQQSMRGIKDIKIFGKEDFFIGLHSHHNNRLSTIGAKHNFIQSLPRLWLEVTTIIALVLFIYTSIYFGNTMDLVLQNVGLFAVASFRIMPSLSKVVGSLQHFKFLSPVIDTLHNEFNMYSTRDTKHKTAKRLSNFNNITMKNVSFGYSKNKDYIIQDVNMNISSNTTIGIIGESGSGKSTSVDIILGLIGPLRGEVLVDDVNIKNNIRSWQSSIGYVPQDVYLIDDTLESNIALGIDKKAIDQSVMNSVLKSSQLYDFVNKLPDGLDTIVGEDGVRLSGGQKQRIGIARALYHNPLIIVFDESTSSLDEDTERSVMEAVDSLHGTKTVIVITHRTSLKKYCDRIYIIKNKQIHEEC